MPRNEPRLRLCRRIENTLQQIRKIYKGKMRNIDVDSSFRMLGLTKTPSTKQQTKIVRTCRKCMSLRIDAKFNQPIRHTIHSFLRRSKSICDFLSRPVLPYHPQTHQLLRFQNPHFSLKMNQAYSPKFGEYGSDTSSMYSSALCKLLCTRPILTGRISAACARFRLVH
jgi:hypothetical protein